MRKLILLLLVWPVLTLANQQLDLEHYTYTRHNGHWVVAPRPDMHVVIMKATGAKGFVSCEAHFVARPTWVTHIAKGCKEGDKIISPEEYFIAHKPVDAHAIKMVALDANHNRLEVYYD